uniref:N-acylethanolamine-hydrolyzing acid amidase n=1 Tax=Ciona savignyi TaxID=51511 RepID=H2ZE53_CIOSA
MEKPTTKAAIPAKTYIVNLDLPPQERWNNVIKHFDPNILKQGLNTLFKEYLPSQQLVPILEDVAKDLERYIPQPFADELRGLSKALGMKLGDLVLINIIYDVSAFNSSQIKACTSIVAYDSMGRIIHGRNLDYKVGDYLRELTLQVDYQRGGKTLYMATTYAGYIGVITGSKPNAFSITGDQRNIGSILQNLFSAVDHSWPTFFAERRVLEEASDYQSALSQILKTPTIAPVYFIISGINAGEGAIVVRDGRKVANVTTLSQSAHSWYIVETNYDPWVQAPATDDRRDAAINAMNKLGRKNMNPQQLYKVLSVDLVFNSDTTYTTIMSAADASVYQTMIRYDAPPPEELINT